jgi:hypothetical protein
VIAVRGFNDTDGTIQVLFNLAEGPIRVEGDRQIFRFDPIRPGLFIGSGRVALDANDVAGPKTYQPGVGVTLGWRFSDSSAVEFRWKHLVDAKYSHVASFIPEPDNFFRFTLRSDLADTYLFSPVNNFPNEFAGPASKVSVSAGVPSASSGATATIGSIVIVGPGPGGSPQGSLSITGLSAVTSASTSGEIIAPQAAYGIWNGASVMSLSFVQRHDQFDLVGRFPLYQDDCSRMYTLCGGRHVQFWERFQWRTTAVNIELPPVTATGNVTLNVTGPNQTTGGTINFNVTSSSGGTPPGVGGRAGADDVAIYTNVVSNRLYGPTVGCGYERYWGKGISTSVDLRASALIDVVKERAKYERGDKAIAHKRAITEYTFVPELSADLNIWFYPIEGVEMRFGYEIMNFFNTVSSPRPVDFNYGAVSPPFEKGQYRYLEGFHTGIAFIF